MYVIFTTKHKQRKRPRRRWSWPKSNPVRLLVVVASTLDRIRQHALPVLGEAGLRAERGRLDIPDQTTDPFDEIVADRDGVEPARFLDFERLHVGQVPAPAEATRQQLASTVDE